MPFWWLQLHYNQSAVAWLRYIQYEEELPNSKCAYPFASNSTYCPVCLGHHTISMIGCNDRGLGLCKAPQHSILYNMGSHPGLWTLSILNCRECSFRGQWLLSFLTPGSFLPRRSESSIRTRRMWCINRHILTFWRHTRPDWMTLRKDYLWREMRRWTCHFVIR